MRRCVLGWLLWCGWCVLFSSAHAAAPNALRALRFVGPTGCADPAQVRATIERWLEQSPEPVDASVLEVDAIASRRDAEFVLDLTLQSPSGRTRSVLTAQSCETLIDVLALKVATAATFTLVEREQPSPPPAEPHYRLRFAAGPGLGRMPAPDASFELLGGLAFRFSRVELGASYMPAQRVRLSAPFTAAGADIQGVAGMLRGCLVFGGSTLEVPTCLGIELGVLRGAGFGTDEPATWTQFAGSVTLGPALRLAVGRGFALWLEVRAALAFARPSFSVLDRGADAQLPLYRPGLLSGALLGGVELAL